MHPLAFDFVFIFSSCSAGFSRCSLPKLSPANPQCALVEPCVPSYLSPETIPTLRVCYYNISARQSSWNFRAFQIQLFALRAVLKEREGKGRSGELSAFAAKHACGGYFPAVTDQTPE